MAELTALPVDAAGASTTQSEQAILSPDKRHDALAITTLIPKTLSNCFSGLWPSQ